MIDEEYMFHESVLDVNDRGDLDPSSVFATYQDAETYVAFLAKQPGATRISIGYSYLNVSIDGVKFGSGPEHIFFHGGIHARFDEIIFRLIKSEWISPAVVTYSAYSLLTDPKSIDFLRRFTFTIVPVVNVDGYALTRLQGGNRMWRKNRQPNLNSNCVGTDLNRNFDFMWDSSHSQSNPCAEDFRGPKAFYAPETRAVADYIKSLGNVVSYIDFHA